MYLIWTYKQCEIFIDNRLYVDTSSLPNSGYGVFTRSYIPKNTLVEVSHTIPIPVDERQYMTTISKYDFNSPNPNYTLVAMGFGGIYNNHKNPNVDWIPTDTTIKYITNQDIQAGQELLVNYGPNYFKLHNMVEEF